MNLPSILAVAIGGALGSVLRYTVGFAVVQRLGPGFPWGTLFINVTGSFVIGVVAEFSLTRAFGVNPLLRMLLMTGLVGGYTTFSTFSLEAVYLINERAPYLTVAYVAGSVILGIAATYAGIFAIRFVAGLAQAV